MSRHCHRAAVLLPSYPIGSALLQASLTACAGDPAIHRALLHVHSGNEDALKFYARHGFTVRNSPTAYVSQPVLRSAAQHRHPPPSPHPCRKSVTRSSHCRVMLFCVITQVSAVLPGYYKRLEPPDATLLVRDLQQQLNVAGAADRGTS